jgi:hypothetical protein
VLGQNQSTQRHRPRKVDGDRELLGVMRKIVETFPRHGSERTHRVLTGPNAFGGWRRAEPSGMPLFVWHSGRLLLTGRAAAVPEGLR